MAGTTLTSTSVLLFALYTLITIVGGTAAVVLGRGRVNTMGEKAKNDAVATITNNFSGLLQDAQKARDELATEREKRAELKGEVTGLTRQIEKLSDDMEKLRRRLEQVEGEKKDLEAEKEKLEKTIDFKSVEYQKLMVSIQSRIDNAVKGVREDYEARINQLEDEILQKNNEIARLKQQLEEKSHVQPQPNPVSDDSPVPDSNSVPNNIGAGSNPGSNPNSPD